LDMDYLRLLFWMCGNIVKRAPIRKQDSRNGHENVVCIRESSNV
jgi:hypothetical protein